MNSATFELSTVHSYVACWAKIMREADQRFEATLSAALHAALTIASSIILFGPCEESQCTECFAENFMDTCILTHAQTVCTSCPFSSAKGLGVRLSAIPAVPTPHGTCRGVQVRWGNGGDLVKLYSCRLLAKALFMISTSSSWLSFTLSSTNLQTSVSNYKECTVNWFTGTGFERSSSPLDSFSPFDSSCLLKKEQLFGFFLSAM